MAGKLFPVILSGGSGTRLWPLSRKSLPKQLLSLVGDKSLLQQCGERASDPELFGPLMVVASAEHRFMVAEQLREVGARVGSIILEPMGRNTAPAVACAALKALESDPAAHILVMPADHYIPDARMFHEAVAATMAVESGFCLFGIRPDHPSTAYGYICAGEPVAGDVRRVEKFVEKPPREVAESYLAHGGYFWNAGIFKLPAALLIEELRRYEPAVVEAAEQALAGAKADLDFVRLDDEAFARAPSISLDHAVMERTDKAMILPADFPWSDVGSWSALLDIGDKDAAGNIKVGAAHLFDTKDSYVRSEGPLVATLGVKDLVVVVTNDAVLVADRNRDQDVKAIVDELQRKNLAPAVEAPRVYRPWGWYEGLRDGDRFQVKQIMVKSGESLSLQMHHHRAEHWVVVGGTAQVTVGEEQKLLSENQSVYIPLGAVHRLTNPGKVPLHLIEVQSGAYLGEDDIVRLQDSYNRLAN